MPDRLAIRMSGPMPERMPAQLGTHGREAHCELYISRGTHGPEHMSEKMSELVPDKMFEYMPEIARVYIFAIYISR